MTKKEVLARIKGMDKDTQKRMVCACVGHSRIQTVCFGYFNCGRCEAQIGDSLVGAYSAKHVVIVGHDCPTCRANYETCTWRDKFLAVDPFPNREKRNG